MKNEAKKPTGGYRPGAGRKPNVEKGLPPRMVKLGISVTQEQSQYLIKRAEKGGKSVPEVIRTLVQRRMERAASKQG